MRKLISDAPDAADHRRKNARLEQRNAELAEQLVKLKDELAQALAGASALATRDPETGMLNWRAFEERARIEIARASRHQRELGLVVLTPDDAGSGLMSLVGIGQSYLREYDPCARTERGEIVILLCETSLHGALVVAERIRALAAKGQAGTISAGCAGWPAQGRTLARIVEAAREALAVARAQGGDRVLGSPVLGASHPKEVAPWQ